MSSNLERQISFNVSQPNDIEYIDQFTSSTQFIIEFRLVQKTLWVIRPEGEDSEVLDVHLAPPLIKSFRVAPLHLLSDLTSALIISQMLSLMYIHIEEQEDMIQRIHCFGSEMVNSVHNVGLMTLPMVVDINLTVTVPYIIDDDDDENYDDDDDDDDSDDDDSDDEGNYVINLAITESMDGNQARSVPATGSSIQSLEKVSFDDSSSIKQCVICLEEFLSGLQVTRMPCSHIYHEDCIVQWLKGSNLCPLCRFKMPKN